MKDISFGICIFLASITEVTNFMKLQTYYAIMLFITLLFILIVNGQNVAAQNIQTVKKELPAIKTEQPPTIDGILNDACWQEAPQAIGFTDQRTEKPAKNHPRRSKRIQIQTTSRSKGYPGILAFSRISVCSL